MLLYLQLMTQQWSSPWRYPTMARIATKRLQKELADLNTQGCVRLRAARFVEEGEVLTLCCCGPVGNEYSQPAAHWSEQMI